jgi:hypothetical protein
LSALTLALGVVVRRAVAAVTHVDVALKWPNDLVWDERKLGGILLELTAEAQGGCHVVAGIGLNVDLPPKLRGERQPRGGGPRGYRRRRRARRSRPALIGSSRSCSRVMRPKVSNPIEPTGAPRTSCEAGA